MEFPCKINGEVLEGTKENKVLCVIHSLERALNARPPQEVARAVVDRFKLLKHAPRVNEAGCAALGADLKSRALSFAAGGPESAAKVTAVLPPFPKRDASTLEEREAENRAWSAALPATRANVRLRLPFDSYALGTAAPLQWWPKLRGQPTLVAHPLTKIEGVELTTIKPMDVLAKKLVHAEKSCAKKRKREQEGCDSEEEEEESGEEESG